MPIDKVGYLSEPVKRYEVGTDNFNVAGDFVEASADVVHRTHELIGRRTAAGRGRRLIS